MRSKRLLGWVLLASTLAMQLASADVASEARFFDELGRRAYASGKYDSALESFQLAYEIAPSVGLLYNIALCADLAGRDDLAFSLYREYLSRDDKDSARRSDARTRSDRLKSKLCLVEVTSDPPGAFVYVDRKELGQFGVTPTTIAVDPGAHRLLLERGGFSPASVDVHASRGTTASSHTLLTAEYGELTVRVTPASATLQVTRQEAVFRRTLSGPQSRLPVGSYRVEASAPGYVASQEKFVIEEGETTRLDLELVPLPQKTGRLLVSTGTEGAEVFIDGRRAAVTPATLPAIGVGLHRLEVRQGSRVVKRTLTIRAGRTSYVELEFGSRAR